MGDSFRVHRPLQKVQSQNLIMGLSQSISVTYYDRYKPFQNEKQVRTSTTLYTTPVNTKRFLDSIVSSYNKQFLNIVVTQLFNTEFVFSFVHFTNVRCYRLKRVHNHSSFLNHPTISSCISFSFFSIITDSVYLTSPPSIHELRLKYLPDTYLFCCSCWQSSM